MFLWPWRWIGKGGGIRVSLGKIAGHISECAEVWKRTVGGPKDHGIIALFDQDLGAFEAICLGEADSLAATVLEDFCGHIYSL